MTATLLQLRDLRGFSAQTLTASPIKSATACRLPPIAATRSAGRWRCRAPRPAAACTLRRPPLQPRRQPPCSRSTRLLLPSLHGGRSRARRPRRRLCGWPPPLQPIPTPRKAVARAAPLAPAAKPRKQGRLAAGARQQRRVARRRLTARQGVPATWLRRCPCGPRSTRCARRRSATGPVALPRLLTGPPRKRAQATHSDRSRV